MSCVFSTDRNYSLLKSSQQNLSNVPAKEKEFPKNVLIERHVEIILRMSKFRGPGDRLDQFLAILDFEPTWEAWESYEIFSQ